MTLLNAVLNVINNFVEVLSFALIMDVSRSLFATSQSRANNFVDLIYDKDLVESFGLRECELHEDELKFDKRKFADQTPAPSLWAVRKSTSYRNWITMTNR